MRLEPSVVDPLRRLGGDELVHQLFRTFLGHAPTRIGDLRSAAESRDLEALTRAVHSLRSSSAMLGAMELSELAGDLEGLADEGRSDELVARVPELEEGVRELVGLLERELGGAVDGAAG